MYSRIRPIAMEEGIIFSPQYAYIRGRQLEGTYPGDRWTGIWPVTALRVGHGWGSVPEDRWPYDTSVWPPVEPPGLDAIAKNYRLNTYYRRARTMDDCRGVLQHVPVMTVLELTDEWHNPLQGRIRSVRRRRLGTSHSVLLMGYDDIKREFSFQNSWGAEWGDRGYGHIAYDVFRETCIESWAQMPGGNRLWADPKDGIALRSWGLKDNATGGTIHGCELVGPGEERRAWSYAVEANGNLEVEELFVMPQYKRKGYGTELLHGMRLVASRLDAPLRLWISHADANLDNMRVVNQLLRNSGLKIAASQERWAGHSADETSPTLRRIS